MHLQTNGYGAQKCQFEAEMTQIESVNGSKMGIQRRVNYVLLIKLKL